MKKIFYLLLLVLLSGCSDLFDSNTDKEKPLPQVKMVSVVQVGQETIITAELTSKGDWYDATVGFFFKKGEEPEKIDQNFKKSYVDENRQIVLSLRGLTPGDTYYFIPVIFSMKGTNYGEPLSYEIQPYESPDVPCQLEVDKLIDCNAFPLDIIGAYGRFDVKDLYLVEINTGFSMSHPKISFRFLERPMTGTYTTTNRYPFENPAYVYMFLNKTGDYYDNCSMFKDQTIYVSQIDDEYALISFCDLNYAFRSSTIDMKVRGAFKVRLR